MRSWLDQYPSARYVAPFALFVALLGGFPVLHWPLTWEAPIWVLFLGAVIVVCWPKELPARPRFPFASVAVGVGVFILWVAPDIMFPSYRQSPLFSNAVFGHLRSSMPVSDLRSPWVLSWRTARAVVIVPIVEELFWRAWMMRWIVNTNFQNVRLGTYAPLAFWITALLFASEHGPYWDVGLITGIIYNYWMVRTKSIADCILMHAVTNGVLSGYVIATSQWQYWQ